MHENHTIYELFHIVPFSNNEKFKYFVLLGILSTYLFSMTGNMIIALLVCTVNQLHTPMYFFLLNLSIQDIIHVSNIQPKLLAIAVTGDTAISFSGCVTQIFIFALCIVTEYLLLTSMAYDRFVAICKPLHYTIIMNKATCSLLTCFCWIVAASNALVFSLLISSLTFCKSHDINHVFCEVQRILPLSCTDTTLIIRATIVEVLLLGVFPMLLIITSYVFIISTILKIQTSAGRLKTFSSCSSHLITIMLLCGTSIGSYMTTGSEESYEQNVWVSLLYIILVPMLNPLVYSLRNKEVLKAMKSLLLLCL